MLFHTDFVDSQGGFAFSGGPILFLQKEGDNNWMESFKKRAITCRYPGNSLSIASIYDEVSVTPIKNIRSNQFPLIFLLPKHWKTEQTIELKH